MGANCVIVLMCVSSQITFKLFDRLVSKFGTSSARIWSYVYVVISSGIGRCHFPQRRKPQRHEAKRLLTHSVSGSWIFFPQHVSTWCTITRRNSFTGTISNIRSDCVNARNFLATRIIKGEVRIRFTCHLIKRIAYSGSDTRFCTLLMIRSLHLSSVYKLNPREEDV